MPLWFKSALVDLRIEHFPVLGVWEAVLATLIWTSVLIGVAFLARFENVDLV
jgi:hypothetical protein